MGYGLILAAALRTFWIKLNAFKAAVETCAEQRRFHQHSQAHNRCADLNADGYAGGGTGGLWASRERIPVLDLSPETDR